MRIRDCYDVFRGTNKRQAFTIWTHSQSIRASIRPSYNHVTFTTDLTPAVPLEFTAECRQHKVQVKDMLGDVD